MPKKSEEFVIEYQQKGKKRELAGPYFQRREAMRALPKLLAQFGWGAGVRAIVYERPARNSYSTDERNDRKQWTKVAHAEKENNGRSVRIVETRSVA